ncbi:MAG TPA: hypothetical protein VJ373_00585, partial [Desulfatiglandales bacterium]|nr:hypothetical protein [Desulfatiglandales bacterium]
MDTKLLQKIAIGLICLSVLVIIGLTVFQHQLLKKMSQDPNQGTAVTSESTGGAVSGPDEAYRERLSEREIVTMFTESLSPDNKLTEAQQQDLVDAMYQERKNVYLQQGPAGDRPTFTSEYNDELISATMNMVDRTYDGYARSAGAA